MNPEILAKDAKVREAADILQDALHSSGYEDAEATALVADIIATVRDAVMESLVSEDALEMAAKVMVQVDTCARYGDDEHTDASCCIECCTLLARAATPYLVAAERVKGERLRTLHREWVVAGKKLSRLFDAIPQPKTQMLRDATMRCEEAQKAIATFPVEDR